MRSRGGWTGSSRSWAMSSGNRWQAVELADLVHISSGTRPPVTGGTVPVMGANGQTGWTSVANYGPGHLVGRVGAAGAVNYVARRCWASDNVLTLKARSERCDEAFLTHLLRFLRPEKLAARTAQPLVTQTNLAHLSAEVPDEVAEQRRIAEILDTVDEAIRRTEQVIAKLQRMKQGLLHDLLTRGLDEHGELRDPERHPEQFKDSPLGLIPVDWSVHRFADLMQQGRRVTYGIVQPGSYTPGGVLLLRGQDYINGWQPTQGYFRVHPSLHRQYMRSITVPGDVLLCIVGATTGATAVVPEDVAEANITQTTARLAFDQEAIMPAFAEAFISSNAGRRQVRRYLKGSAQPGLNLGDVEQFLMPVPPRAEQERVVSALDAISLQEQASGEEARKLRTLKQGLMDDLLSGRVRVSTPDAQEEAA
ncbi:MAG: restriction endonuclease subunit S [Myxococcota bacterium]